MIISLKDFVSRYISNEIDSEEFADEYMDRWKKERNEDKLSLDDDSLSEFLSSVFCLADMYNPDEDREYYELNDEKLKAKLIELLQ